jgi:hypothetical protein
MPHSIEVSPYMGLAAVTLWGDVTVEERARALDDTLGRLHGAPYGILLDFQRARATADSFEASNNFARRLAGEERLRDCRVAYVYAQAGSVNPVVEKLAQARRFRFRRFAAASSAIDWLLTPRRQRLAVRREPSAREVLADLRLAGARC